MYIILGTSECFYCTEAENFMKEKNLPYLKKNLDELSKEEKIVWEKFIIEELKVNFVPQILKVLGDINELKKEIKVE